MCLICDSLFSNEAMKLKDHLTRLHSSKLNVDFKKIKADCEKQINMKALFAKRPKPGKWIDSFLQYLVNDRKNWYAAHYW